MKIFARMMVATAAMTLTCLTLAATKDKVAVFDLQAAILGTDMAKSEMTAFEGRSDIAKMIKDAEKLQKEIQSLREEAVKSSAKLTADKAEEQKRNLEFKQTDLESIVRKLNAARQTVGKKLMETLGPRLEQAVKSVVEAKNIGLLLDRKAAIHAEPSFDITPDVVTKLNAASKSKL